MTEILYSKQAEHFTYLKEQMGITQARLIRRFEELEESYALSKPNPFEANPWHITSRSVNRWYNGKSQIKEENAARIIEAFGIDCSVAWLRGEADFMNETEEQAHILASINHDGDLLALGFGALSESCGFTLTTPLAFEADGMTPFIFGEPSDTQTNTADFDANEIVEHTVKRISSIGGNWKKTSSVPMMIVARDGKSTVVPRSEIEALQKWIRELVDFELSRMLNR